jgi:hypothetical protein
MKRAGRRASQSKAAKEARKPLAVAQVIRTNSSAITRVLKCRSTKSRAAMQPPWSRALPLAHAQDRVAPRGARCRVATAGRSHSAKAFRESRRYCCPIQGTGSLCFHRDAAEGFRRDRREGQHRKRAVIRMHVVDPAQHVVSVREGSASIRSPSACASGPWPSHIRMQARLLRHRRFDGFEQRVDTLAAVHAAEIAEHDGILRYAQLSAGSRFALLRIGLAPLHVHRVVQHAHQIAGNAAIEISLTRMTARRRKSAAPDAAGDSRKDASSAACDGETATGTRSSRPTRISGQYSLPKLPTSQSGRRCARP